MRASEQNRAYSADKNSVWSSATHLKTHLSRAGESGGVCYMCGGGGMLIGYY